VVRNTALNSSDNLHHSSDDVYRRGGVTSLSRWIITEKRSLIHS